MTGPIYAFASVATCTALLLALVFYALRRIKPCSLRLGVSLARIFSFTVEMDASSRNSTEVADRRESRTSRSGPRQCGPGEGSMDAPSLNGSVGRG